MIEIKELEKRFGLKRALDGVNLTLGSGIYGLLGPNGAGKTTLMRTLMGIYPIGRGQVLVDGSPLRKGGDLSHIAGYLPQRFGMFYELSVQGVLEYIGTLKKLPKEMVAQEIPRVLAAVNLEEVKNTKVGALSGGMLRRLGIAQALLGSPRVLIFDEPTAGLDPEERMRFKNIVSSIKRECTIIISTHIVDDVDALCDQVVIMRKGKILGQGNRAEIKNKAVQKVYELPVEKENLLGDDCFKGNRYERDGIDYLRILSSTPPPAGVLVNPTIEDGYLCMIKELSP